MSLKPELYTIERMKDKRNMFLSVCLIIVSFLGISYSRDIIDQKYKLTVQSEQYKIFEPYMKYYNGEVDISSLEEKVGKIYDKQLNSKDINNVKYIEKYINDELNRAGLKNFKFEGKNIFKNKGLNNVYLDLTIVKEDDIINLLDKFSKDGFLGDKNEIRKDGTIFQCIIHLKFKIV